MTVRFNAPPGWDVPSNPQWTPPQEWKPQPWWPPAPEGWVFWVPVDETPAVAAAPANPVHVNQAAPPAPAEPQSFWSLRMSRDSVIAFGMVLVVLLGLFVWTRWSAGGDEREQRRVEQFTDAGTDVCLKAVRNLFTLPSRVEIPTSTLRVSNYGVGVSVQGRAYGVEGGSRPFICTTSSDDGKSWTTPSATLG